MIKTGIGTKESRDGVTGNRVLNKRCTRWQGSVNRNMAKETTGTTQAKLNNRGGTEYLLAASIS